MAQAKRGEGPFVLERSDGCSALSIPYRWITKCIYGEEKKLKFLEYCIEHDEAYWYGGSRRQRKTADFRLYRGVREQADNIVEAIPYTFLALIMLIVTRTLGTPHLPTPFRWMRKDNFSPVLNYTVNDVERNETVATLDDADVVKTILESGWTSPITVQDAVTLYQEGRESQLES